MLKTLFQSLALLLMTAGCEASTDFSLGWDSVDFRAGVFRVEAKVGLRDNRMKVFRVWVLGQRVRIPEEEYRHISLPVLHQIEVTMVAGFKGSAYVKVPLLVDKDDGLLENGGAWIFYLKDKMYVGKRFVSVDELSDDLRTPAQSKKSSTR